MISNMQISYEAGNFNFSYGFGATFHGKHYASGSKGWEFRNSGMAGYGGKDFNLSLGTNFWSGTGGMKEFKQQTGIAKIKSGDFGITYENDGMPFGITKGSKDEHEWYSPRLGDGGDSFRTAAASISIGDFSMGVNLFTGERTNYNGDTGEKERANKLGKGRSLGYFGERMPNGFVNENGTPYRFGGLYIGYGNYRIGINSDRYVRHPEQDIFAHNIMSHQPGFWSLSNSVKPYFQYQTPNKFTSW
jgi:hypothetical protein